MKDIFQDIKFADADDQEMSPAERLERLIRRRDENEPYKMFVFLAVAHLIVAPFCFGFVAILLSLVAPRITERFCVSVVVGWVLGFVALLGFFATLSPRAFWWRYAVPLLLAYSVVTCISIGQAGHIAATATMVTIMVAAPVRWLTGWRCDNLDFRYDDATLPRIGWRFSIWDLFEIVTLYAVGIGLIRAVLHISEEPLDQSMLIPFVVIVMTLAYTFVVAWLVFFPRSRNLWIALAVVVLSVGATSYFLAPDPLESGLALFFAPLPVLPTLAWLNSAGWRIYSIEGVDPPLAKSGS